MFTFFTSAKNRHGLIACAVNIHLAAKLPLTFSRADAFVHLGDTLGPSVRWQVSIYIRQSDALMFQEGCCAVALCV